MEARPSINWSGHSPFCSQVGKTRSALSGLLGAVEGKCHRRGRLLLAISREEVLAPLPLLGPLLIAVLEFGRRPRVVVHGDSLTPRRSPMGTAKYVGGDVSGLDSSPQLLADRRDAGHECLGHRHLLPARREATLHHSLTPFC